MPGAPNLGLERMRGLLAQLPDHLLNGYRDGNEIARSVSGPRARSTFVVGLGGSGIAADLARVVLERETRIPYRVVRTPALPASADRDSLVILLSHSGKTWEILQAYDDARRRSARLVAVTSGGDLAARAERDGVPLIVVNPDMPQRSAVGLILGSVLGLLDPWFPESNEGRMAQIAETLRGQQARLARASGPAARFAARLGGRIPFVYAEAPLLPLARRWATQIEENAKRLAVFDEVPEMFHNALVGWDRLSRAEGRRLAPIALEWGESSAEVQRSSRYLARLVARRGVVAERLTFATHDLLQALLEGILFGDHMSLHLAARAGVDPAPVDAIWRFKGFLAGSSREEGAAGPRKRPNTRTPPRRAVLR